MSSARYDGRLGRYFDKHYGQYANTAKWSMDHAPNERKIFIPELERMITLICSPSTGEIIEKVERCKNPKLSTGPDYKFAHGKGGIL